MADQDNVEDFIERRLQRGLGAPTSRAEPADSPPIDFGGGPPHSTDMNDRLAKLEGAYDALKVVRPLTVTIFGLLMAVVIGGLAFLGNQNNRIEGRIDRVETQIQAIPQRISEEFRAMRAESAAQASAIATAITAAKQQPTQVILVPAQPQAIPDWSQKPPSGTEPPKKP